MPLHEYTLNPHVHTAYSDGAWFHAPIAEAALRAGLDIFITTDHNVWVDGPERYYEANEKRVLALVGEEIHDVTRAPQKNHLLVYGAQTELSTRATQPQALLDAAHAASALTFLAHPHDPPAPLFQEPDLSWANWEVTGFTGLEIWNYMSEFKGLLTSKAEALRHALNPELGIAGPFPETLARWDALTTAGRRVVGIGGADAHGTEYQMSGLKRVIFPYAFLFQQVNTHLLTEKPLTGKAEADRQTVLEALANGHGFVGYDGAAPTRGFRFTANAAEGNALMGDEVVNKSGVTLQMALPQPARLQLLRDGQEIAQWDNQTNALHIIPPKETGVFRVEAQLRFQGCLRGWIYSNPIYVR